MVGEEKMIIAIHQPNFIPNMPYFLKMALCDKFVMMYRVNFSKTGFQNFQNIFGKRWQIPTFHGLIPIMERMCCNGRRLVDINTMWIDRKSVV